MTFEETVTAHGRGRIIVCNLLDTHDDGILARDILTEFLELWRKVFAVLTARGVSDLPIRLVDAVDEIADPVELKNKYGLDSTRDYRFLLPASAPVEPLATAKLAGFVEQVSTPASMDRFAVNGIAFPYNATTTGAEMQARMLEGLDPDEREFYIGRAGLGDRPLWVTKPAHLTSALDGLSGDARADQVRDVVGLVHRAEGDIVVVIDVPLPPASNWFLARPTFLDGVNPRFVSVARDAPDPFDDNWGWTFDLRALFVSGLRGAGVPERLCVCDPVELDGVQSAFNPLGIVQLPRGDVLGTYDDEFAKYLQNGRTRDDLVAALVALV